MTGAEGMIAMALSTPPQLVLEPACRRRRPWPPRRAPARRSRPPSPPRRRSSVNQPASPGRNVSPSTTTPSTDADHRLGDRHGRQRRGQRAGPERRLLQRGAGDRRPAPTRTARVCAAAPRQPPSSSRSTTPLVSTANTPHSAPDTTASSTALTGSGPDPRAHHAQHQRRPEHGDHRGPRLKRRARMPRGRIADGDDDRDRAGQQRRPRPLPAGHPPVRQPRVDRQREQQRRDQQRLHQQHRAEAEGRGLQREPDGGDAGCPATTGGRAAAG